MPALLVALLLAAAPAEVIAADDAPPPADPAGAPAGGEGEAEGDAGAKPDLAPDLDFELLPEPEAPRVDRALERRVARRRTVLTWHQGLGIATWTGLAATTVVGQLHFDDRFRGGGDTGRYRGWHRGLALGTSGLFLSSGLLALLAPEPYEKESEARLDTATLHKVAMAVAAAGMVTQVVLGVSARGEEGSLRERDLASAHQVVGYATLGALTVGAVVLFF